MERKVFNFVFSEENLIELIKKYYVENGRNVSVKIDYNVVEDFFDYSVQSSYSVETIISASENVSIAGMNLTKQFNLSMDEVEDIVRDILEKDGYEVFCLTNNTSSKESFLKTLLSTDHGRTVINKTFTVTARVKEEEKILQKKIENNK